ncbi:MAG TPA: contractile injection system protein, VgrG/Pvc8 family, partial [Lachnospiraceae bacterium]|nr:contractile injection system protein, VgrG/Pvc8 family [Lachnospiraceae bacterium]
MTNEVITYDRLELDLPVSLNSIKEFRLEQQLNEHNRLRITGTLKESEQDFALDQLSMESEATIVLDGKPLFCGVVTKCLQKRVNDVSEIELTFADHSILLDIRKRNRSFQDVTVAYRDSMKRIAKEYDGSLAALGYEEIKPSVPLIQYQETDWVFLKRLASQLRTYLLPDCKSHRANIYLGAHMGYQHEEEMIHYKIEKEYGNYLSLNASSKKQVTNEYVTYIVEMEGNYE